MVLDYSWFIWGQAGKCSWSVTVFGQNVPTTLTFHESASAQQYYILPDASHKITSEVATPTNSSSFEGVLTASGVPLTVAERRIFQQIGRALREVSCHTMNISARRNCIEVCRLVAERQKMLWGIQKIRFRRKVFLKLFIARVSVTRLTKS